MSGLANSTTATSIPTLRYRDAAAAIDWLCKTFGFEQRWGVPGENGTIVHTQLVFGNGMIILSSARDDEFGQLQQPLDDPDARVSRSPYIIVIISDVTAHHAAGVQIVAEPEAQEHSGRLYSYRDPEGNLRNFGSYDPWMND